MVFATGNGRCEAEDEDEERKTEHPHKKRCLEENPKDIVIDAVFDNDEDVALHGGDSDSDGYVAEVVDETRSDTMKRKVLSGSVFTSCCDLVEEEQSLQTLISLLKLLITLSGVFWDYHTCLINMYKAFLHDCDIPKANAEQRLRFLRDSLVELCSQDMQKSYTKASVSITQLSKLLKMALTTKNKEAVEKIHSGHYTSCLDLWVSFIAANVQDCDLQPLLYTIIQWSFHVSFPELATILIMRLKKFNERSTMEGLKRVVKRFIEQMNIEFVQMERDEAAFSPNDQQSIGTFLQLEKLDKTAPYTQYYQSIIEKLLEQNRRSEVG
ncbi:hypothetical protein Bca4012_040182 [Brassica carinata]